jgi:hypothetical protein
MNMDDPGPLKLPDKARIWGLDFEELGSAMAELEWRRSVVGKVNPRPAGWRNYLIQLVKKLLARMFSWYARPFIEFNAAVGQSLQETDRALHDMAAYTHALDWRLMQLEKPGARLAENYRTAYVIGLFGSGRQYVSGLILQNIGQRAKYFRDDIRVHPGPTPMIYSGHATIKHPSRAQHLPAVTRGILRSVEAGFADLIFAYRHPLDSLLTNWVWWRTYIRENRKISGISEVFEGTDDLCAELERNFASFKAFAEGDAAFFAGPAGARFLSFPEYVEETALYLQAATLALRFEDFAIDPAPQFSKVVELISARSDFSGSCLEPPKSKPYGYLAVKKRVPRFNNFIGELDAETKGRLQKIGYSS